MRFRLLQPLKAPTASIIFLHGSGGDAQELCELMARVVRQSRFTKLQSFRFLFPEAPLKKYTYTGGHRAPIWHDRINMEWDTDYEDLDGINQTKAALLPTLKAASQPPHIPVFIGGFSQGGSMALHCAFGDKPLLVDGHPFAGIFTLSAYLVRGSQVYRTCKSSPNAKSPLFMAHGSTDEFVPFLSNGKPTQDALLAAGLNVTTKTVASEHSISAPLLDAWADWILRRI